ncbi:hypothetical protein cypCar_00024009 [Cyprinus carpio]|nr:hypothetical protein cypCar_00024009 [Cyprinus carpio]
MQRRYTSSSTEGMPPERNKSQTLGSESSLDEGGVFDCLKPDSPTSPQQLFPGLVGVSAGNVSSAPFQAAGLVLGSPSDVFIQMASSSRDEGSHRTENPHYLPRPPQHHHHHSGQHHSSLLHAATSAERHGSRDDGSDDVSTPAPALSELKAMVTWLQRGFPFILILLAKNCFQHKLGIAICIGMISTFAFANSKLKHQVALRGKFYLLIEELSQLFRALVPIQLWYKYIMGEDPSSSYFLGAMLIIIYSLCKSYGTRASAQQCSEAGDVCAICQTEFREPIALLCQHVFCEECLCLWFDRERTCPLCRQAVVETLRNWKDGTTSAHFQIY